MAPIEGFTIEQRCIYGYDRGAPVDNLILVESCSHLLKNVHVLNFLTLGISWTLPTAFVSVPVESPIGVSIQMYM